MPNSPTRPVQVPSGRQSIQEMIQQARKGITYRHFKGIVKQSPFDLKQWADFLHLSERTMQRYQKENKTFQQPYSERILEIDLLVQKGIEVFEDKDNFRSWLSLKNRALGDLTPNEFMDSSFGLELISDELDRIEHGVFS
ncbi:MAG: MbcA/ParS/Xre antitoxin family protein [Bacteroidota bacterium]